MVGGGANLEVSTGLIGGGGTTGPQCISKLLYSRMDV